MTNAPPQGSDETSPLEDPVDRREAIHRADRPAGVDPRTDARPTPVPDGGTPDRVLVLNPVSGDGEHGPRVRELAEEYGFAVRETERSGDAIDLAREAAAAGAGLVVACGGDGTVNEAVRGIWNADALDRTTFGIVPGGTGNNFAENVGIEGVDHAFEVIAEGDVRRIDLGTAAVDGGEPVPFLNSCIGGLTAHASASTDHEQKDRLGVLAYVVNTLREVAAFEGLDLHVEPTRYHDAWDGDAVMLLAGNGRRFPESGRTQADMEDGLLDVTIVEEHPTIDLAGEAVVQRLFGSETPNISRMRTPAVDVTVQEEDRVAFSLDGEMVSASRLHLAVRESVLELPVGPAYEPTPREGPE